MILQWLVLLFCAPLILSGDTGKFTGTIVPRTLRGGGMAISVEYEASPPGGLDGYLSSGSNQHWTVFWGTGPHDSSHAVSVSHVDNEKSALLLTLSGTLPSGNANSYYWAVLYQPKMGSSLWPFSATSPPKHPASCDSDTGPKPPFCPVSANAQPDLSITGAFFAGGGTKPIYHLQAIAGLYKPSRHEITTFVPGFTLDVEINQSVQPPNTRSRFDPDSITAGFSLLRVVAIHSRVLDGIRLEETLPGGEFSRTDPSSNIVGRSSMLLIIPTWQPGHGYHRSSNYAFFRPLFAIEAGKNLNHPAMLDKAAINLVGYNAITRGLLGADARVARATDDKKTDQISLDAYYRLRLPVFDEPLIRTKHGNSTAMLTTRARHWAEVDLSYTPFSSLQAWKALSFTAQYQYGNLPPVFNQVDHKVSIGLTFKLTETGKPPAVGPLK